MMTRMALVLGWCCVGVMATGAEPTRLDGRQWSEAAPRDEVRPSFSVAAQPAALSLKAEIEVLMVGGKPKCPSPAASHTVFPSSVAWRPLPLRIAAASCALIGWMRRMCVPGAVTFRQRYSGRLQRYATARLSG